MRVAFLVFSLGYFFNVIHGIIIVQSASQRYLLNVDNELKSNLENVLASTQD